MVRGAGDDAARRGASSARGRDVAGVRERSRDANDDDDRDKLRRLHRGRAARVRGGAGGVLRRAARRSERGRARGGARLERARARRALRAISIDFGAEGDERPRGCARRASSFGPARARAFRGRRSASRARRDPRRAFARDRRGSRLAHTGGALPRRARVGGAIARNRAPGVRAPRTRRRRRARGDRRRETLR